MVQTPIETFRMILVLFTGEVKGNEAGAKKSPACEGGAFRKSISCRGFYLGAE